MSFSVLARDASTLARAGMLDTPHGPVETPAFLPVATQGGVKALTQDDLDSLGARALLANAYHLHLRPGDEAVRRAGGLHAFMGYDGALLTDSGGFQVMSLAPLRRIREEGIEFKSHLDGSLHELTPEGVVEIQARLGSDIWTSLDVCLPYPSGEGEVQGALERTMRWTERSALAAARLRDAGARSLFFPILQGGHSRELRLRAAEHLAGIAHDGVSIGGLSVGEPKPRTWETLAWTAEALHPGKPRYLMGVGTPEDAWEAVAHGADMMDCVWPTRLARHGAAVTRSGRLNLSNAALRDDDSALDSSCSCRVCRRHSRAYIAHLFRAKELAAYALLSYHNVHALLETLRAIRRALLEGRFQEALRELRAGAEFSAAGRPRPGTPERPRAAHACARPPRR